MYTFTYMYTHNNASMQNGGEEGGGVRVCLCMLYTGGECVGLCVRVAYDVGGGEWVCACV